MTADDLDRFLAKVTRSDSGCWLWTAALSGGGNKRAYGIFRIGKRNYRAHRASYEHFIGPVPDGHELHHTCGAKRCVNPRHLEPLTRSAHARKHTPTHCANGHPLSGENLYVYRGYRKCRECRRVNWRRWNATRAVA